MFLTSALADHGLDSNQNENRRIHPAKPPCVTLQWVNHTPLAFETSLALFSPDGKYLIAKNNLNELKMLEIETGRELFTIPYSNGINSLDFSPDGKSFMSAHNGGVAKIFNAASGVLLGELPHDKWLNCVKFSPNGKLVATGSDNKNATIFDATTFQKLFEIPHTKSVESVSFSPDNETLMTATHDGVYFYSVKTRQKVSDTQIPGTGSAHYFPDGKTILTSSSGIYGNSYPTKVIALDTGKTISELSIPKLLSVQIAPDGKTLFIATRDKVKIIEPHSKKEIDSYSHVNSNDFTRFSRDGSQFVATDKFGKSNITSFKSACIEPKKIEGSFNHERLHSLCAVSKTSNPASKKEIVSHSDILTPDQIDALLIALQNSNKKLDVDELEWSALITALSSETYIRERKALIKGTLAMLYAHIPSPSASLPLPAVLMESKPPPMICQHPELIKAAYSRAEKSVEHKMLEIPPSPLGDFNLEPFRPYTWLAGAVAPLIGEEADLGEEDIAAYLMRRALRTEDLFNIPIGVLRSLIERQVSEALTGKRHPHINEPFQSLENLPQFVTTNHDLPLKFTGLLSNKMRFTGFNFTLHQLTPLEVLPGQVIPLPQTAEWDEADGTYIATFRKTNLAIEEERVNALLTQIDSCKFVPRQSHWVESGLLEKRLTEEPQRKNKIKVLQGNSFLKECLEIRESGVSCSNVEFTGHGSGGVGCKVFDHDVQNPKLHMRTEEINCLKQIVPTDKPIIFTNCGGRPRMLPSMKALADEIGRPIIAAGGKCQSKGWGAQCVQNLWFLVDTHTIPSVDIKKKSAN